MLSSRCESRDLFQELSCRSPFSAFGKRTLQWYAGADFEGGHLVVLSREAMIGPSKRSLRSQTRLKNGRVLAAVPSVGLNDPLSGH
jgi:hypothetical protein